MPQIFELKDPDISVSLLLHPCFRYYDWIVIQLECFQRWKLRRECVDRSPTGDMVRIQREVLKRRETCVGDRIDFLDFITQMDTQ